MGKLLEKAIKLTAKGFDKERKLLYPDGTTCKLLKIDGTAANFSLVQEITSGWITRFSEYRRQFVLEIAAMDNNFGEVVGGVTHVAIDTDVYILEDGDAVKPSGERPTWAFYCKRTGETFV